MPVITRRAAGVAQTAVYNCGVSRSTLRRRCQGTLRVVPVLSGAKVALCPYCNRTVAIMRPVRDGAAGLLTSHPYREYPAAT